MHYDLVTRYTTQTYGRTTLYDVTSSRHHVQGRRDVVICCHCWNNFLFSRSCWPHNSPAAFWRWDILLTAFITRSHKAASHAHETRSAAPGHGSTISMLLSQLPEDVLYHILSHLDYKSLSRLSQVCKTIYHFVNRDVVWRKIAKEFLNTGITRNGTDMWENGRTLMTNPPCLFLA